MSTRTPPSQQRILFVTIGAMLAAIIVAVVITAIFRPAAHDPFSMSQEDIKVFNRKHYYSAVYDGRVYAIDQQLQDDRLDKLLVRIAELEKQVKELRAELEKE